MPDSDTRPKQGSNPDEAGKIYERQAPIVPSRQEILDEIEDAARTSRLRRRLLPRAILVGVFAGCTAVAFRLSLTVAEETRGTLLETFGGDGISGLAFLIGLLAVGISVSVWMVRSYAPAAAGSGIPQLKAVLLHKRVMNWLPLLLVKFCGGVVAIGSGLTLGREGPTVQMGGATGKMVGRIFGMTKAERFILIAAGGGAGLAAAFNAPLAGLIFVMEEIHQRFFSPLVFFAALIASVVADTISRFLLGQRAEFHTAAFHIPPLDHLPLFFAVGVVTGLLGIAFNKGILLTLDTFGKLPRPRTGIMILIVAVTVGTIGWFFPSLLGSGHGLTETALAGRLTLGAAALYLVLRFIMTMASYGTGAPGGIFAPLLVIGALGGLVVGLLGTRYYPSPIAHPEVFAVVGMAACFTAVVRAPLTGIVLILEMTAGYELMLPLLVSCLTAYALAEGLRSRPIYELLMERDLRAQRVRFGAES